MNFFLRIHDEKKTKNKKGEEKKRRKERKKERKKKRKEKKKEEKKENEKKRRRKEKKKKQFVLTKEARTDKLKTEVAANTRARARDGLRTRYRPCPDSKAPIPQSTTTHGS